MGIFGEECMAAIKQRWPDMCPECGYAAWVGPLHIHCVQERCRHGSPKEAEDYLDLLAEYDTTDEITLLPWPGP